MFPTMQQNLKQQVFLYQKKLVAYNLIRYCKSQYDTDKKFMKESWKYWYRKT